MKLREMSGDDAKPDALICLPFESARVPSVSKPCARCSRAVAVARSSQAMLLRWPDVRVICYGCWLLEGPPEDVELMHASAAALLADQEPEGGPLQ